MGTAAGVSYLGPRSLLVVEQLGRLHGDAAPAPDHPLTAIDPLFASAEPYALWAIEKPVGRDVPLFKHPAIRIVDDLQPFYLRKVRILNGLHSAMVAKFLPAGFETVQDVLRSAAAVRRWVRALLFEEIVPTIAYRFDDVAAFADETFDRLRNPFMRHRLGDIALNHAAKAQVRLKPTHDEYVKLFGVQPKKLAEASLGNHGKHGLDHAAPPLLHGITIVPR